MALGDDALWHRLTVRSALTIPLWSDVAGPAIDLEVASRHVDHVTLPDGKALELPDGATGADAAAAIGPALPKPRSRSR